MVNLYHDPKTAQGHGSKRGWWNAPVYGEKTG